MDAYGVSESAFRLSQATGTFNVMSAAIRRAPLEMTCPSLMTVRALLSSHRIEASWKGFPSSTTRSAQDPSVILPT